MKEEKKLEDYTQNTENLRERTIDATKDAYRKVVGFQQPASNESTQDPIHYSDWLTLLGFEIEQNALQYIQQSGVKLVQNETWLPKIRLANTYVSKISYRQKVIPEVKDLENAFQERITKLKSEPTFIEHTQGMNFVTFAFVELAKIHCFQKHLNSEYVKSLLQKVPESDDAEGTVKFCLPTKDEMQKTEVITSHNPVTNTLSMVTENLNFRIIGTIGGEDAVTKRNFTGFIYGFGLPQISVVNYNGTFLLRNGYHRAFALFKKGHKFLPCILLSTDSFELTGAHQPGFFSIDLIRSDKSPILSDFDTEAAVLVPRRRNKAMITVHAESQVVPV